MELLKLKGKIAEKYGTYTKFAEAMEMSVAALSQRMTCKTPWRLTEVAKACHLLNIPGAEITIYFLPESIEHS